MIENLFNEISKRLEFYTVVKQVSGANSATAIRLCNEIMGMKKAFQIVTGMSFTDYIANNNK